MPAPTTTIRTITIARAIIPVVSPETETPAGTGTGVISVSFSVWALIVAVGVAEAAARAEPKACKVPARKVTATRIRIKMIRERGM